MPKLTKAQQVELRKSTYGDQTPAGEVKVK